MEQSWDHLCSQLLHMPLVFSEIISMEIMSRLGKTERIGTWRVCIPSFTSIYGHHPQWLLSSGNSSCWAFSLSGYSVNQDPVFSSSCLLKSRNRLLLTLWLPIISCWLAYTFVKNLFIKFSSVYSSQLNPFQEIIKSQSLKKTQRCRAYERWLKGQHKR